MSTFKQDLFRRRRFRVRNALRRRSRGRLRLSVHRSNRNISAQLIDDSSGRTLASASSLERSLGVFGKGTSEAASVVGRELARRASAAGALECYFDRGGFLFHGRVKALADAAREAGLKF